MNDYIYDCYPPPTEQQLFEFEATLHTRLPADFRRFLTGHNGGSFLRCSFDGYAVSSLYGLGTGFEWDDLQLNLYHSQITLSKPLLLPIASAESSDQYCIVLMTCKFGQFGQVVLMRSGDFPIEYQNTLETVASSFQTFLNGISTNDQDICDLTDPIERSVCQNDFDKLEHLLAQNRESNQLSQAIHASLHYARVPLAEKLLALDYSGVLVKHHNADWLFWGLHSVDCIKLVVSKGVDVNLQDSQGDTALHRAIRHQHVRSALTLLSLGANPDIRNVTGETARSLCTADPSSYSAQYVLPVLRNRTR